MTKRKVGRPSKCTPAVVQEICERLSKGEPLAVICRDDHMPDPATAWRWQRDLVEVSQAIARAREDGFDAIAAETLTIADDDHRDWQAVYTDGVITDIKVDGEHIQRSKLRIDTRLKLLAKWDPKRYGEKLSTEITGKDGGPIEHNVTTDELAKLPREARERIRQAIQEAVKGS